MILLVNTLAGEEFQKFVSAKMEDRKSLLIAKKKLEVKACPEFHDLFLNSKFASCKSVPYSWLRSNRQVLSVLAFRKKMHMQTDRDRQQSERKGAPEAPAVETWTGKGNIHHAWYGVLGDNGDFIRDHDNQDAIN